MPLSPFPFVSLSDKRKGDLFPQLWAVSRQCVVLPSKLNGPSDQASCWVIFRKEYVSYDTFEPKTVRKNILRWWIKVFSLHWWRHIFNIISPYWLAKGDETQVCTLQHRKQRSGMVWWVTAVIVTVNGHSTAFWSANMEAVFCLTMLLKVFCFVLLNSVSDVLDTDDRWLRSVICFHPHCVQWVRSSSSPGSHTHTILTWGPILVFNRQANKISKRFPLCSSFTLHLSTNQPGHNFCEIYMSLLYSLQGVKSQLRPVSKEWSPIEESGHRSKSTTAIKQQYLFLNTYT